MKAVIFAMGTHESLEPINSSGIKAMTPIFGKSGIECVFDMLKIAQVEKTYVIFDDANGIVREYCSNAKSDICAEWVHIDNAASVWEKLACEREDAIAVCDIDFYDFDIKSAMEYHKQNDCDITAIVQRGAGAFSVVTNQQNDIVDIGRTNGFADISTTMLCGIYVLSAKTAQHLADNPLSLAKPSSFGDLLKHGLKISAYHETGYMCRICDSASYLQCHVDILSGRTRLFEMGHKTLSGVFSINANLDEAEVTPPCYIGKNVRIGKGAVLTNCVICDNAVISSYAKITQSVVQNGAFVGEKAVCCQAIVCEGAAMLNSSKAYAGSVIGRGAVIGKGACVEQNVKIAANNRLDDYKTAMFDMKTEKNEILFDDDSCICGETGSEITPAVALKIGQGAALCGKKIAVGHNGTKSAQALSMALGAGALSAGADIWNVGECIGSELDFAIKLADCDFGFYVESESYTKISAFSKPACGLDAECEQKIEAAVKCGAHARTGYNNFGKVVDFASVKSLYQSRLSEKMPKGAYICFNASGRRVKELCAMLSCNPMEAKITFQISGDGRKASAFCTQTGFVSYEKLAMLCMCRMLAKGENVRVPHDFPHHAKALFEKYGMDFSKNNLADNSECEEFFTNGFLLAINAVQYLQDNDMTLEKALTLLPEFAISRRVVGIKMPTQSVFARVGAFCAEHEDITVKPTKSGKTLLMYAECEDYETASELCDICQRIIENEQ